MIRAMCHYFAKCVLPLILSFSIFSCVIPFGPDLDAPITLQLARTEEAAIHLSWSSVPGANEYILTRSNYMGEDFDESSIILEITKELSYIDNQNIEDCFSVRYSVEAIQKDWSGSFIILAQSEPQSLILEEEDLPPGAPARPAIPSYTVSDNTLRLSWEALEEGLFYDVYYSLGGYSPFPPGSCDYNLINRAPIEGGAYEIPINPLLDAYGASYDGDMGLYIRICAMDSSMNQSPFSSVIRIPIP